MRVLQLTAHFSPNIGGLETHLNDLVEGLVKRNHQVTVLTYQPLSTDVRAPIYEKKGKTEVFRIPWIRGFFYKLVEYPALEFLYLVLGLFFITPFILSRKKYQVIHTHGLVAAAVGVFWGKLFNKRVVVSTHSLYGFPSSGLYRNFVKLVLSGANVCLCLSKKSVEELMDLGISPAKIKQFTYWIDLDHFKPSKKTNSKEFVILFVGRLVAIKGIKVLIKAFKNLKGRMSLVIAGDGPLRNEIMEAAQVGERIKFVGKLDKDEIVDYYNKSDLVVVPSINNEGFGRVILESLACSVPVLGSNRGSIPEAMDLTVGRLVDVNVKNLQKEIAYLKKHPNVLKKLKQNSRKFALKRYSEKNIETIINSYDK